MQCAEFCNPSLINEPECRISSRFLANDIRGLIRGPLCFLYNRGSLGGHFDERAPEDAVPHLFRMEKQHPAYLVVTGRVKPAR